MNDLLPIWVQVDDARLFEFADYFLCHCSDRDTNRILISPNKELGLKFDKLQKVVKAAQRIVLECGAYDTGLDELTLLRTALEELELRPQSEEPLLRDDPVNMVDSKST